MNQFLGQSEFKKIINLVEINQILIKKKRKKITEPCQNESDFGPILCKKIMNLVNLNLILSTKICNKTIERHHIEPNFGQNRIEKT